MIVDKETLRTILQQSEETVHVTFIKKDGSLRNMYCTLNPDLIPFDMSGNAHGTKDIPHLLTVFDMEEEGWRMINFSSKVEVHNS